MAHHLQDLCENFCALANSPVPELHEDGDGEVAFNIFWRDVAIDLVAQPRVDPAHAFIVFHLGSADPAHADAARILQALLQTNFVNLRANQPVLSCHPETGNVMLQWAIPLEATDGRQLHDLMGQGVDLALLWRQTYFLAPAPA
jgi:hypothetical protein